MNSKFQGPPRKGVYILPNLLTTASLFSGFMGILWSLDGRFELSAIAILVSCLFDGLDGKVARMTNTSSDFGVQLDSLADLVAFGVAPALMVYQWELSKFGRLGIMAAFLLIACGALRLARFNVQSQKVSTSKKFFVGLPIPASGCILASFYMFSQYLPDAWYAKVIPHMCLAMVYALSFLMVSRVRYFAFKELGPRVHPFRSTVTAILLFALIATEPKLLGFVFFFVYLVSGPFYTFIILPYRARKLRESPQELS